MGGAYHGGFFLLKPFFCSLICAVGSWPMCLPVGLRRCRGLVGDTASRPSSGLGCRRGEVGQDLKVCGLDAWLDGHDISQPNRTSHSNELR